MDKVLRRSIPFYILLISLAITMGGGGVDWEKERPKERRESACIQIAIDLYNVTMSLEDEMKTTYRKEYYENILKKEGVELKEQMDDIEHTLIEVIKAIELAGGVIPPKLENITTTVEEFSVRMELEYGAMMKNIKDLTEKLLAGVRALEKDKKHLLSMTDDFAKLRKKYLDTSPVLVRVGILLQKPEKNAKPVTVFDISVLQSLLKYYKEIDVLEDEVVPIAKKYKMEDLDETSEEFRFIEKVIRKIEVLENVKIGNLIEENSNMLHYFELITNAAVERSLEFLPELVNSFDEMKLAVINRAQDFASQDEIIRGLVTRFNGFLERANAEATKRAFAGRDEPEEHDEL